MVELKNIVHDPQKIEGKYTFEGDLYLDGVHVGTARSLGINAGVDVIPLFGMKGAIVTATTVLANAGSSINEKIDLCLIAFMARTKVLSVKKKMVREATRKIIVINRDLWEDFKLARVSDFKYVSHKIPKAIKSKQELKNGFISQISSQLQNGEEILLDGSVL